jgi:hypothetical protein
MQTSHLKKSNKMILFLRGRDSEEEEGGKYIHQNGQISKYVRCWCAKELNLKVNKLYSETENFTVGGKKFNTSEEVIE